MSYPVTPIGVAERKVTSVRLQKCVTSDNIFTRLTINNTTVFLLDLIVEAVRRRNGLTATSTDQEIEQCFKRLLHLLDIEMEDTVPGSELNSLF